MKSPLRFFSIIGCMMMATQGSAQDAVLNSASVEIPATRLPFSAFASREAAAAVAAELHGTAAPPPLSDLPGVRRYWQDYNDRGLAKMRRAYAVDIRHQTMGGVGVDVVSSTAADPRHADRVLINLHGGAFMWGAGSGALVEAIPIASVARTTVITVDYRLAPEHRFPAAVDDVVNVYKELLKTHRPGNIGIYGCSAGGALTAEATAAIISEKLPAPGAIGTFCGTGLPFGGDAATLGQLAMGQPPAPAGVDGDALPYLEGVPASNPLAYPGNAPLILRSFPPTLLLAGSRDFALSALTTMSRRLEEAGVETHLQIFDGLGHAFFMNPDLPESREAYAIISRFFDTHLR